MWLQGHELEEFQKNCRLVPGLASDDGVMLRKARLMEDCINDVVRPMRSAAWSITVGEPDAEALHVTVTGVSEEERLRVALPC